MRLRGGEPYDGVVAGVPAAGLRTGGAAAGALPATARGGEPGDQLVRRTQWAFYLDVAACSGCKACQIACKDRNGLELGILWRRVYEVVGGGWQRDGEAWTQDVFAYNLSVGCNHCERPICMEVCPSGAITKRCDGVVLIAGERCLGCRYCAWACPYGSPQYDAGTRRMTKCDFCAEELDRGRPPACVAACPARALDFGEVGELEKRYGEAALVAQVHPLPESALTLPALLLRRPAGGAERGGLAGARVMNREEVMPG